MSILLFVQMFVFVILIVVFFRSRLVTRHSVIGTIILSLSTEKNWLKHLLLFFNDCLLKKVYIRGRINKLQIVLVIHKILLFAVLTSTVLTSLTEFVNKKTGLISNYRKQ